MLEKLQEVLEDTVIATKMDQKKAEPGHLHLFDSQTGRRLIDG